MGNKCDLQDDIAVSKEEIKRWCDDNGDMPYVQTSAKDNVGVEEAFRNLIEKALQSDSTGKLNLPEHIRITRDDKDNGEGSMKLDAHRKKAKKSNCC